MGVAPDARGGEGIERSLVARTSEHPRDRLGVEHRAARGEVLQETRMAAIQYAAKPVRRDGAERVGPFTGGFEPLTASSTVRCRPMAWPRAVDSLPSRC